MIAKMWADLAAVVIAFGFGIFCQWYLSLRRSFPLHLKFPNGQILAFGLPVEMWRLHNADQPLRLELHDDGKPPQVPIPGSQAAQPQPAQAVPS